MSVKVDPTCRYTETHEWVRVEGDVAWAGITDYAQQQLSDIVYVELPEVGASFGQKEVFATVESVKAASDCYMPLSGEILEVNGALEDAPELVNQDPYGKGWFIKFRPTDLDELDALMDPTAYEKFAQEALEKGEH